MRYLISSLLALPLICSCTATQAHYYGRDYYAPLAHVEVYRKHQNYNAPRHYHGHNGYRAVPRGEAVVVNPRFSRPPLRSQQNVHGHNPNVHGHNQNIHGHNPNVHGHNSNVNGHNSNAQGNSGNTITHPPAANEQAENQGTKQSRPNQSNGQASVHGHG